MQSKGSKSAEGGTNLTIFPAGQAASKALSKNLVLQRSIQYHPSRGRMTAIERPEESTGNLYRGPALKAQQWVWKPGPHKLFMKH